MNHLEIFKALLWIENHFGKETLYYFLAEMIYAHQHYNYNQILNDLNQLLQTQTPPSPSPSCPPLAEIKGRDGVGLKEGAHYEIRICC